MLISHESPICMLEESRNYNDYDYALVHLFEEIPEYLEFFKESLRLGRTVYLDNSIFELGEAFDVERFAYYIKEMQSIAEKYNNKNFYYIIPDVIEDSEATKNKWIEFESKFGKLAKRIGVAQGKTFSQFYDCFLFMKAHADMIAIPFNSGWMRFDSRGMCTKEEEFAIGRARLIHDLASRGYLGLEGSKIHLLGCFVPQEYRAYKNIPGIVSGDTSNPIVHGILGKSYGDRGLRTKESTKLVDLIHYNKDHNYGIILDNIAKFKEFV